MTSCTRKLHACLGRPHAPHRLAMPNSWMMARPLTEDNVRSACLSAQGMLLSTTRNGSRRLPAVLESPATSGSGIGAEGPVIISMSSMRVTLAFWSRCNLYSLEKRLAWWGQMADRMQRGDPPCRRVAVHRSISFSRAGLGKQILSCVASLCVL